MKHCILIHGKPSKKEYDDPCIPSPSNHHWFPWIQKQLLLNDVLAQTIEMPRPYAPDYTQWKNTLERFTMTSNDVLVGHSRGAGFLVRYISEVHMPIDKLILVAPSFRPTGKEETDEGAFYNFKPDLSLSNRVKSMHVVYSSDDPVHGIRETVDELKLWYPFLIIHQFHNKGHFTIDEMKTTEFPELLSIILSTHD